MNDEKKDFEINIRIKNARLVNKIKGLGYKTVRDFSLAVGLSYQAVLSCLSLKTTVYDKKFNLRPIAEKLSEIFKCQATDLFPESVWYEAMKTTVASVQMTENEIRRAFPSLNYGDINLLEENIDFERTMKLSKSVLKDRYHKVVELRSQGMTYEEVGAEMEVTRERIRQMEDKAHRKIRGTIKNREPLTFQS